MEGLIMAEIFESYWWLLFPLGFFIAGGLYLALMKVMPNTSSSES